MLPDKFGNAVIDAWLARQHRTAASFGALDRLCYIGRRGMGALTFEPATGPIDAQSDVALNINALRQLAAEVLQKRAGFAANSADAPEDALRDILRVGTSAGGARAKALVAWNAETGELRSGQLDCQPGFRQWLLKFDGVARNADKELDDPQGYGAVEYAYHHMAMAAGVTMSRCRLFEEGGRRHFMTQRFDRRADGARLHMQSLGALAHLDFNQARAHGYEQALLIMRQLGLPKAQIEQQFRRMVFNVVARNQDDHVKNIAFLMDKTGRWSLAPAFDVTWAYNQQGSWTHRHQMTINGKSDDLSFADFEAVGALAALRRGRPRAILNEVVDAVRTWPTIAAEIGVDSAWRTQIAASHRLDWAS